MESHSDGEVWGLSIVSEDVVVTSGDDNKIKAWSVIERKCIANGSISNEERKAPKGGASSMTTLAASKCARAVAYNQSNGHIAVGHNDGTLTIRASVNALDDVVAKN